MNFRALPSPALFAVLITLSYIPSANAQTSQGTADISPRPQGDLLKDMPEIGDTLTHDGVGAGIDTFGKTCKEQAAAYEAMKKQVLSAASRPGLTKEMREKGQKLAEDIEGLKHTNAKAATWSQKFGKFLDTINVVATFAKAAGYAYEGDRTGAVGVLVDEGVKKITTGVLGTAGTIVPGIGSMAGATAGEYIHETYTRPILEGHTDAIRTQEAKDKLLGANVPGQQIIAWDGSVRTLPPDMYVDPETGNIKQRTPDEQKAYEDQFRRDLQKSGTSDHPLDQAAKDLKDGKINDAQFDKIVKDFSTPEQSSKKRHKDRAPADDEGEGETGAKSGIGEKSGEDQENHEGEEEETLPEPKPGDEDILKLVKPVRVTAATKFEGDYSSGEFKNIVTETITVTFWNVGALAGGYEGATYKWRAVASLNGVEQVSNCSGSFSGGPSGSLTFACEGATITMRLLGGRIIQMGDHTLRVQNPEAFANWP